MILLLIVFISILLYLIPSIEYYSYRQDLINVSKTGPCKPGYILANCKQTTPKITERSIESISTICQCIKNDTNELYNVLI